MAETLDIQDNKPSKACLGVVHGSAWRRGEALVSRGAPIITSLIYWRVIVGSLKAARRIGKKVFYVRPLMRGGQLSALRLKIVGKRKNCVGNLGG